MTLRTFQIVFDRPGATFTPGEVVSGNVSIDATKEKTVRGLNLSAKGEAKVHWTERKSVKTSKRDRRTHYEHYTNSEKYFNLEYTLLGTRGADGNVKIHVGHQQYPFSFQLPHNIPSSFEHEIGHIRYTIKAVIDRPWKFDHECKAAFSVVSSLDLNRSREQCIGIEDVLYRHYHRFLCCFDAGSIKASIHIPSTGYVPGQTIDTRISLQNSSNSIRITHLCTKLERVLKFHARSAEKKVNADVKITKTLGPFDPRNEIISQIQIPPIPPSNLVYCNIINLEYKLRVCIHVSGMHSKITKYYPILIGTVPLYSAPSAPPITYTEQSNTIPGAMPMPMPMPVPLSLPSDAYPRNSLSTGVSTNPIQPIGFATTSQDEWQLPPPSYEECMSRTDHIKDHNESDYVHGANEPFAPRYPVFSIPTPHLPSK